MFKKGDTIAIVACSNSKNKDDKRINYLQQKLHNLGLFTKLSKYLYNDNKEQSLAQYKASELLDFYKNNNIKAIFDISGGDYANSLLTYLNFDIIKDNYKPFFGYSDLTTIINALYSKTKQLNYLYQPLNIVSSNNNLENFKASFLNDKNTIFEVNYYSKFKGNITAPVVGGNIRCLLKLAGTEYLPKTDGKIFFLESLSGNYARITTYFEQLKQMKCFNNVEAVLLGTFTELQEKCTPCEVIELAKKYIPENIPLIKTEDIGHSNNSKCLIIGKNLTINI